MIEHSIIENWIYPGVICDVYTYRSQKDNKILKVEFIPRGVVIL